MITFRFTLIIYYLMLARQTLVLVHTLIYIHSNIYFKNFLLNFRFYSGSNLCKGTLTFILLPLLDYDPAGETSNAIHHFLSPFYTKCLDPSHFITFFNCDCDLFTLRVQFLVTLSLFQLQPFHLISLMKSSNIYSRHPHCNIK